MTQHVAGVNDGAVFRFRAGAGAGALGVTASEDEIYTSIGGILLLGEGRREEEEGGDTSTVVAL